MATQSTAVQALKRLAGWWRSRSLAFQFTTILIVVTALLMTVGGVGLGSYLPHAIRTHAESDLAKDGEIAGERVAEQISTEDLAQPMTGERYQQFASFLRNSIYSAETVRVEVRNKDGLVIFSDNEAEVGRMYAPTEDLLEALNGEVVTEIPDLEDIHNEDERQLGALLEVYTPLRHSGEVTGALEIYTDYSEVASLSSKMEQAIWLGLGGMLLFVYLPVAALVIRGSALISRHEADLERSNEEIKGANDELKERNRQLLEARARAATDGLTGIFNHRTFQERVRAEVEQAKTIGTSVSLIMLDIDGFKKVNDELGHLAGDKILQEVTEAIISVAGGERTYRYGGDEFAILLPETEPAEAAHTGEAIREVIEDRLGNSSGVTASVGWGSFPSQAESAEALIYGADAAMYEAKRAGKNRVVGYTPERTTVAGAGRE